MHHAAIYVRVSTNKQDEDGTSLTTQEEQSRRYAADQGWTVAGVFSDTSSGAKYRERPGLSALRERVRAGDVSVVLCYALDRLSRNQAHVYILAEEIEQHGARLAIVTEDFEDSAVGRFIRSAKAFAAEVEHEKIVERTQRGMRARATSGKPVSGRPLYGYRWADAERTRLEEDPVTGAIVRRIYRAAAAGATLRHISMSLAADGVQTPSGKALMWDISMLRYVLRHSNYTGNAIAFYTIRPNGRKSWKRDTENAITLPPGTYPPLIDQETWDAVQLRLVRNQRESARNNSEPHESLLRGGIVRCGYCGAAMRAKKSTGGNGTRKYTCHGRLDVDVFCEGRPSIAAHTLDSLVWDKVRSVLMDPDRIALELERLRESDPTITDLAAIDTSIARLERQRGNVQRAIAMVDDEDSLAGLVTQLTGIADQIKATKAERVEVLSQQTVWHQAQKRLGDIQQWCRRVAVNLDCLTYDEKRDALTALGVAVKVFRKDHATRYDITMRIPLTDRQTVPCVEPTVTRSIGP